MLPRRREFLLSSLIGAAAVPLAAQDAKQDDVIFRADTFNVAAPVTVLDRDGRLVNGLEAKDFTLLDNGVARDFIFEYSDFSIRAKLDRLEALPKPKC